VILKATLAQSDLLALLSNSCFWSLSPNALSPPSHSGRQGQRSLFSRGIQSAPTTPLPHAVLPQIPYAISHCCYRLYEAKHTDQDIHHRSAPVSHLLRLKLLIPVSNPGPSPLFDCIHANRTELTDLPDAPARMLSIPDELKEPLLSLARRTRTH